jgi:hypothetical protein
MAGARAHRTAIAAVALCLGVLGAVSQAGAHPRLGAAAGAAPVVEPVAMAEPTPAARAATTSGVAVPLIRGDAPAPRPAAWLALVAVGATVALRRRDATRGVLAVGGVVALTLLSFGVGDHSVHHLGDDAECAVEAASTHLGGVVATPAPVIVRPASAGTAADTPVVPVLDRRSTGPDRGRAPPA